ncbi:MAG: DUF1540 domain-containing protein [Eubacteriales bacterium]|nr:DUF1540 domain-containing protein [Eubacteriales bacterium]MCI7571444.1 DUF1540 domain-containing protein [Clostridiales bacterium]MDD7551391.1 DUF1540 domain-containing protein [Clostridia bacterium]MDY5755196.1 DUF1540 domain-containing protein [Eubacteriales bacterium]
MSNTGNQSIGCAVTSCSYNENGCDCRLNRIQVMPCNCNHTGCAEEENYCGSYKAK